MAARPDFTSNRRTTLETRPDPAARGLGLGQAFVYGCTAGLLGVAVMTVFEKAEQAITKRPSSYVPGHTLRVLLGLPDRPNSEMFTLNMAMHYGQGALAAGLRGIMAFYGIRGPFADFMFTGMRLCIDQTLENYTGVGALPWTWPVNEQIIDIVHKGVFALTTGYLADLWIQ